MFKRLPFELWYILLIFRFSYECQRDKYDNFQYSILYNLKNNDEHIFRLPVDELNLKYSENIYLPRNKLNNFVKTNERCEMSSNCLFDKYLSILVIIDFSLDTL